MAEFKGRRCDRNGCTTVVENVHTTPPGWVKVTPVPNGYNKDAEATLEFCSEYCHAIVALERYEATTGKRLVRQPKKAAKVRADGFVDGRVEGARRANHIRHHVKTGNTSDTCQYCNEEMTPVG